MKTIHYPNEIRSHLVTIAPMAPFIPKLTSKLRSALHFRYSIAQGRQTGGVGGVATPPEFWMGGLNTCQPPLILRRFLLGGVGSP